MLWLKVSKYIGFTLLLIVVFIPAVVPLFNAGFMETDDGGWMIIRLSAFYDTIRDGQIPARLLERLNYGYGYPVANFLYPGFLYLGSLIHLIGFGFITTIKIMLGVSLVFSGLFCFMWLRKLFKSTDALFGAIVYVYAPYHLFDVYKRGSVGEALALSIVPLVFYGMEKASTVIVALAVFGVIVSHNSLALFFLPIFPLYALLRKSFLRMLPGMVLGVLLSAFFTIPALYELRYTNFSEISISNPLEYFAPLSLVGVAIMGVFLVVLVLIPLIYGRSFSKAPYHYLTALFIISGLVSLIFAIEISGPFWGYIDASFVQFPFRLLAVTILTAGFLAAYVSYIAYKYVRYVVIVCITGLLVYSTVTLFSSISYTAHPEEFYTTNDATTTVHDEYLPTWVKKKPTARPAEKIEVLNGNVVVQKEEFNSDFIRLETSVTTESRVRIHTLYWPGWKAYVNGESRQIEYDNELGAIELQLHPYDERIQLEFQEDLVRIIANSITILAAMGLLYYISRPILKF